MISVFSGKKMQKVFAASLGVWLSGIVFLFCCGVIEARAAETEFCPLAKAAREKSHCDKTETKSKSDSPLFSNETNDGFDCCGFLPAVFDKARKLEKNQPAAVVADKIKIERTTFFTPKKAFEISRFYRPPPLEKEKIFIKNCVFRI